MIATPTNLSPSRKSIAIMPFDRGRENSVKFTFLTVPCEVAINTFLSSTKSRTGKIAVIRSFSCNGNKLTIGLPRDNRPACGN